MYLMELSQRFKVTLKISDFFEKCLKFFFFIFFIFFSVLQEKKNIFSTRNIYELKTEPHNWEVQRRFSDFKWLSERLKREFPAMIVKNY